MHFYDRVVTLFAGRKADAVRSFEASEALGIDSVWKDFAVALAKGDDADARWSRPAASNGRADAAAGERHFRVADLNTGARDVKGALRGRAHRSIATLPGMAERTVTLMGLTKPFSRGGSRIGFAYAPRRLSRR